MSYQPQPDSLAGRVVAFFRTHPDEELTRRDIADKFDVSVNSISALLNSCFSHSLLAKRKDVTGDEMIVAGPKMTPAEPVKPAPAPAPSAKPAGTFRQAAKRALTALPDPQTLKVKSGVPFPVRPAMARSRYFPCFATMKVGDHIEVPLDTLKRMYDLAAQYAKSVAKESQQAWKFRRAPIDDKVGGIWRME